MKIPFLKPSKAFKKERAKFDPLSPRQFKLDLVRCYNQLALQYGEIEDLKRRMDELEGKYKYMEEL